ncbi:MAG TPA: hypothetical protein DD827_09645 [Gammaproteobacteria bacterium]|nr:hypothetical protein [Gammaproteobacteria bacterium]
MLKRATKKPVARKTAKKAKPVTKTISKSPSVHLERAAELQQLAVQRPKGLLGSLKTVVSRIGVVKEKRPDEHQALEKMEHIFSQLHEDFDHRERLLEEKLAAIQEMQVLETRMLKRFSVPLAMATMVGLGFLFYIAYSMQNSVADMSSNMSAMGGDIAAMTVNTQAMSSNMSQMTGSMQHLNQNIGSMTNDVSSMNRNMGSMSRSMAPIGDAAQTATPMIGMMRSFMPF